MLTIPKWVVYYCFTHISVNPLLLPWFLGGVGSNCLYIDYKYQNLNRHIRCFISVLSLIVLIVTMFLIGLLVLVPIVSILNINMYMYILLLLPI